MSKSNSISALQIFQIIRYGTFVMIGVGLAKLGISASVIGQFETFLMLSGMLTFFWVSGTINTLLANYGKTEEHDKGNLIFTNLLILIILGCTSSILLYVFSNPILQLFGKSGESKILYLSCIYILINSPGFLIEYILWLKNKRSELIYYGLFLSFLNLASVLLPIGFGYPLEYALEALIAISALKLLATLLLLGHFYQFSFNFSLIKNTLISALPLILSLLVSGSAEYIDSFIVKSRFDNVYFAIFRYGAKELPILLIVANTFSAAMLPALAGNLNSGLGELRAKGKKLMHWFFPLTMVLLLTSPVLFRIVFSENFVYSSLIFNIYLLLVIPRLVFPQSILTAQGHTRYLLLSSILEITINVSLSLYLSTFMGLPGIAVGTFIAFCFDKLFLILVVRYLLKIPINKYLPLTLYLAYSVLTLVCFALGMYFLKIGLY